MRPFLLEPYCNDYLWGGERLRTELGKQSDCHPLAECWELSAHPVGQSIIASGEFAGHPFGNWVQKHPAAVGEGFRPGDEFPILVKLIDAEQALSIQVHPRDEYARRVENQLGKTEMWVVMEAEPDAFLYYGFETEITREEMARRIADDTICDVLHKAPVKAGDVFFIPAGTIHAIGAGILLAEVQQSSDVTYRVYDFGRRGPDGNLRELHVEKALDVTDMAPAPTEVPGASKIVSGNSWELEQLAACPYFAVRRIGLWGSYEGEATPQSFTALLCTDGTAQLQMEGETLLLRRGETAFIPAQSASYTLQGQATLLAITK